MESSPQMFGGAVEECHSSESGWTMYIGSPMMEENEVNDDSELNTHNYIREKEFDDEDERERNYNYNYANNHRDDTSDDSMASDASSGPSHHREHSWTEVQKGRGHGRGRSETKQKSTAKSSSGKKNRYVKGNEEKQEHIEGCSKVRKNYLTGKRK